ncbi:MAG: AAA family ATPase [bacterium]|nr:AAA family ATPase [bacterium]
MTSHSQKILRYLADLAPTGSKITTDVVQRVSDFAYLGWRPDVVYPPDGSADLDAIPKIKGSKEIRRLAAIDSLHSAEQLLRIGWVFVAGTHQSGDDQTRFCLPLLSGPVRLESSGRSFRVIHLGDLEMPGDFFTSEDESALEMWQSPDTDWTRARSTGTVGAGYLDQHPKLQGWISEAAARIGLSPITPTDSDTSPAELRGADGLHVVAGTALYAARDVAAPNMAATLLGWMSQNLADTAFDAMYGADSAQPPEKPSPIRTPLPLNTAQREAIKRSQSEPITVVSGPPGTGKTHLVAAAAIDEVSRGNSVLVATQSDHAARAVAELLDRHPGPRFVRFGNRADRKSVAAELSDGLAQPFSNEESGDRLAKANAADLRATRLHRSIKKLLEREAAFLNGLRRHQLDMLIAAEAPGLLAEDFDLVEGNHLLARSGSTLPIIGPLVAKRARVRLRRMLEADPASTLDDLKAAMEAAAAEAAVRRGLVGGGLTLSVAWDELEQAEAEWRQAVGEEIEATRRSRSNSRRRSTTAVATLASALRAGRTKRRQILKELSGNDFLDVLPLWIGTLLDIDNTLPVTAGMFDVVIFDEASQVDQMRAAPGLARAKRAIVVGDPRQLRHVSFVSDDAMESAADSAGLQVDQARILDVRRNSLFDAAAAAAPITWLDEHFRSVPHIIGFSDRAFYGDRLKLMTQHPGTETRDAIRTHAVDGQRDSNGVNRIEIDAALAQVEVLRQTGTTSIGVISPFRAQADAIEEELLSTYGPEDIDRMGLRVGTVHAFQGSEREVIIASLAISPEDASGSLRFLQNPNLFNVLVTRAKREMIVVTSIRQADLPEGLLRQYLRYADHAPTASETAMPPSGWTAEIHSELSGFGVPLVANYPVAGWSVDLAVGDEGQAFGVECSIHSDGPDAHIEQHLALRRAGWTMVDAFQSRWLTDAEGAAEMLSRKLL